MTAELSRIFILTKVPIPGRVKTRLAAGVGATHAARLHRAMAEDVAEQCRNAGVAYQWVVDGPLDHPWVQTLQAPVRAQATGDLGARIAAALAQGGAALGTDSPTLPTSWIAQAASSTAEFILGPTRDGGCWTIGWNAPVEGWLENVAWSTPSVFTTLLERAKKVGASIDVLEPWYDVDEPSDLTHLRAHLDTLPEACAPRTRNLLQDNAPD